MREQRLRHFYRTVVSGRAYLLLALGLVAAVFTAQVHTDNRLERWIEPQGPAARDYAHFRELFGSDEFVVVALSGRPLFDDAALDALLACLRRLEATPGVSSVDGLPAVYRDLFGGENPQDLYHEFTSTPFNRGLFLSEDRTVAGLLLGISPQRTLPDVFNWSMGLRMHFARRSTTDSRSRWPVPRC